MSERTNLRLAALGLALVVLATGCGPSQETVREPVVDAGELEVPARQPGYRLREGDVIEVLFPSDPGHGFSTPITPGGTISIPMSGEVMAAGLTVEELSLAIGEAMSGYLVDPTCSVMISEIARQPVFVIGEVENPGRFDSSGRITVSMVLAQAGGVKSSGKASSVMVVRTYGVDEPQAIKVDVSKVLSGRDLSADIELRGNDVVYVPKSVIGQIGEFVDLFFTRIAPAQIFYLRGYDIINLEPADWRF